MPPLPQPPIPSHSHPKTQAHFGLPLLHRYPVSQLDPRLLEIKESTTAPGVPGPSRAGIGAEDPRVIPPDGVRRRGSEPGGAAGRRRRGQGLSASGWGLCGEFQRVRWD